MGLLAKLLGPKSKYDESLPYTYEARVRIFEEADDEGDEFKSFLSDTICGLIEHLQRSGIGPDEAELYEIYRKNETPIPASLLVDADGQWLTKQALCRAFEQHYPGHIQPGSCSFEDRERGCLGP